MSKIGSVEVITGGMFCGKTEELIRRLRRAIIAGQTVQTFKSAKDTRCDPSKLVSHAGVSCGAIPVDKAGDILEFLDEKATVVSIDGAQFFGNEIIAVVDRLAGRGIRVIVAGLDMDFRGEPFGPMSALAAIADQVNKLQAICTVCKNPASRTQRLIDGKPARYRDPVVVVGAAEMYEARCRAHHYVPR